MPERILTVRVACITRHTADISAFELVPAHGETLPGYAAGAHIDVHTPGGHRRQYSLAEAAPQAGPVRRYLIAVKHEAGSRGGSMALHRRVSVGDLLAISAPRNGFPLRPEARHHLLLAGGIGLTPLLAMAQHLQQAQGSFKLCVFARSREQLPFADALAALAPTPSLHFDAPDAAEKIKLPELLAAPAAGTHLYLCGPPGFMLAAQQAAAHWPDETVHAEYFVAPDSTPGASRSDPFTLQLARSGQRVAVPADQSAVEALRELGMQVVTSCEQGLCGSCVVGWQPTPADDKPEHRDFCLSATERLSKVALCCSRAVGGLLVIDL